MITITSIYHKGEAGQFRAREDAVGWKKHDGSQVVVHDSNSVLKVEWLEGTLKILCKKETNAEVFTLEGFASNHFDDLFRYFREFCNVHIKKHKLIVSIDESDFDVAMQQLEEAADRVDECEPGSVNKKAREAELM